MKVFKQIKIKFLQGLQRAELWLQNACYIKYISLSFNTCRFVISFKN
jgi:hypothetical protein